MSVYLRGKIYWCEFMWNGERVRRSTKQRTIGKAQTFETNLRLQLAKQGTVARMAGGKAPLLRVVAGEFLDEIANAVKAGTRDSDTERDYRNGCRLLGNHDVWGMRINTITKGIAAGLKFPGGPSTARCAQRTLSRVLKWAAEERGYMPSAPRISLTKYKGREVRIPEHLQEKLLAHMSGDCAHIFRLALDMFMRNNEIMAMRWEDVHLEEKEPYYYVPKGKTETSRRCLRLSDAAIEILRDREKKAKGEWVFPSRWKRRGGPRKTIAKQFRKACKAIGLKGVWLYDAKRECASSFMEHGGDLMTLQAAMGHANIATTSKYLKGYSEKAAEVINRRNRSKRLRLVERTG
jgi:integrase